MGRMERWQVPILIVILILGLVLRVYDLDAESLWTDEAYSVRYAQEPEMRTVLEGIARTEAAPPAYYLLLQGWIGLFGNSEFSVRFPSAILGVMSIAFLFFITRRLLGWKVALLASFFMAVSLQQIIYSQEARMYSLFTFLSLASTYSFLRAYEFWTGMSTETSAENTKIRHSSSSVWAVLTIIAITAALYTNYLALSIIITYTLLCYGTKKRTAYWQWSFMLMVIALLSLPLIVTAQQQFSSIGVGAGYTFQKLGMPAFLAQFGLFLFAIPSGLIVVILALLIAFRDKISRWWSPIALPSYKVGLLVTLFCAAYLYLIIKPLTLAGLPLFQVPLTHSYFLIRHSLFLAPLLYVGFAVLLLRPSIHKMATFCFVVLILTSTISLALYYPEPTKTQWREAAQFVAEHEQEKPLVLLDRGGGSNAFLLSYYYGSNLDILRLTVSIRGQPLRMLSLEEVQARIGTKREFWVVLSKNRDTGDYYVEHLKQKYGIREQQELYEVSLYRFQQK